MAGEVIWVLFHFCCCVWSGFRNLLQHSCIISCSQQLPRLFLLWKQALFGSDWLRGYILFPFVPNTTFIKELQGSSSAWTSWCRLFTWTECCTHTPYLEYLKFYGSYQNICAKKKNLIVATLLSEFIEITFHSLRSHTNALFCIFTVFLHAMLTD